jgi:hypothetical protein
MYHPISLQNRTDNATGIVVGRMTGSHSYWDAARANIYTLYRFQVDGWLKGADRGIREIAVIAMGGVVGDEGQETYPTARLYPFNEYVLFLEGDNREVDDRNVRATEPNLIQTLLYADQQGALTKQWGTYHDHMRTVDPMDEEHMFTLLEGLAGSEFTTPDGNRMAPRVYVPPMASSGKVEAISSFSPSPSHGGTIVTTDFVTITGSGFGAAPGTVFYTNADDGGATFTATGIATDNTAWADGNIINKPAPNAGTGPINVNGAFTSGSNLTVNYGHTAINNTFNGFASSTRQRYYHRNMNGAGGMFFLYNTTSGMAGNALARASFERALERWRCLTFINWFSNGTTATGFAADGTNIVIFDGTLPVGVLGRATSRFSGSGSGACQLANTVWCVNEIDIQFFTDPPTAGFPWEYGPAAPAFTEYDFESVAAHELGHGHGLQHRIAAGQTMNFAIANGAQARTPAAQEVTGGAVRMAYSSAATCLNPAACGTGPMTLLTPGTCTLPVELFSFTGEYVEGQGNVLTWTAFQEMSLLGYFIERSLNGRDFETVDFVQAYGNGQNTNHYGYVDATPGLPNRCFYRLNQRDQNGEFEMSNTIEVMRPGASMFSLAYDAVTSEWVVRSELGGRLVLNDVQGRLLLETQVEAGFTRVAAPKLPSAVYFWRISAANSSAAGKVLVRD